jgi:alkyl hydroperoxide reductase subunit AhpF
MTGDLDFDDIGRQLGEAAPPLRLIFHGEDEETPLGRALADLATAIAQAAPEAVTVEPSTGPEPPSRPALTLAQGEQSHIHYLCLPEGQEGPPFVAALLGLAHRDGEDSEAWRDRLAKLERPAELLLFVSPACPHCAQAVQVANRLALASNQVTTSVIDVQRFEALAKRFSVSSVPLTILDGGLSLTGVIEPDKLIDHLLARDSAEAEAQRFESYIEAGRMDAAVATLTEGDGASHLVSAWRKSTTSSRMGLMLAAEEALEADRAALDGIVDDLIPTLQADDAALQGDTADLLGQIGVATAAKPLEALLKHPNPDVAEIAGEALEAIRSRGSE